MTVTPLREANVIHSSGRRMNSSVGITLQLHAVREHHDVHADQAHVVGQRHPGEIDVVLVPVRRLARAARVGEDVPVREHDALRFAGRARRRTG